MDLRRISIRHVSAMKHLRAMTVGVYLDLGGATVT
ncbi:hypothetical protein GCK32_012232 [Trichostrongylus colubriformis]|uniref:Uncharacterized protein n=1 Tax=Trichostrongylus colubriformis TaxID=6319 RepID=A0AAN8J0X2_TRICO